MFAEFEAQLVSRFLHELVALSATFQDARFEAAGTVGDFARRDLFEHHPQEI